MSPRFGLLPRRAFTLVETLVSLAVFCMAAGGIYTLASQVMFLVAKNTGINVSHNTLQYAMDYMGEQLRASPQIVDVAQYSSAGGVGFLSLNEADSGSYTAANPATGNAIRFVRVLPLSLFVPPNDGSGYTEANPQDPSSYKYPDYLNSGASNLSVQYPTQAANLADPNFVADLAGARLFLRYPYLSEADPAATASLLSTGAQYPGLRLSAAPTLGGTAQILSLVNPLPAKVPSCNQAYLIVVSAFVLLNSGDNVTSQLIYYPDVSHLARNRVLTTAISPQTLQETLGGFVIGGNNANVQRTNYGPLVFSLAPTAGNPANPTARGSVRITLPVYAPNVDNTVVRRGGTSAMVNLSLNIPVQLRRRASF